MTGLYTAEAGAAEHVMDHYPGLLHGLAHQLGLHRPDHGERTVPTEAVGSIPPGGDTRRHVQVLTLVSAVHVETVGDPPAEGEVHPLTVTSDEYLSRSKRSTKRINILVTSVQTIFLCSTFY